MSVHISVASHLSTGRPDLYAYNGDFIWRWCIVIDVTDILSIVLP